MGNSTLTLIDGSKIAVIGAGPAGSFLKGFAATFLVCALRFLMVQFRRVCRCTNPDSSYRRAGEHDAGGINGDPVNPRLQVFRVRLEIARPSDKQAEVLVEAFQKRCPVNMIAVRDNRY